MRGSAIASFGPVELVQTRMKAAAYTQGGKDWEKLFREQDKDHSGQVDWPEFLSMCRRVLKLTGAKADDKSLGRVFGMLDGDRSGCGVD